MPSGRSSQKDKDSVRPSTWKECDNCD